MACMHPILVAWITQELATLHTVYSSWLLRLGLKEQAHLFRSSISIIPSKALESADNTMSSNRMRSWPKGNRTFALLRYERRPTDSIKRGACAGEREEVLLKGCLSETSGTSGTS